MEKINKIKKYWKNFKWLFFFLILANIGIFAFNGGSYYKKWPEVHPLFLLTTMLFCLLVGYYLFRIYDNKKILYVTVLLVIIVFIIGKVLLPLWYLAGFFVIMFAKNKVLAKLYTKENKSA